MPNHSPEAPSPSESRHASQSAGGTVTRWLAPAALLLAVVAVGVAVWALIAASSDRAPAVANPAASTGADPAASDQTGDPKERVCVAFETVSRAVSSQTNTNLGADPVAQAAVAGNARLALIGGGQYLLGRLDPGTSADLANAVRSFGNDLQYIGVNALAGVPNSDPVLAGRLTQADETRKHIGDLCR